jgi:hypothetical protein
MSDALPQAIATSEMTIGGITLRCHVLDDGRRVLEADGMDRLVEALEAGELDVQDADRLGRWMKGQGDA